jgi:hypothetical protein
MRSESGGAGAAIVMEIPAERAASEYAAREYVGPPKAREMFGETCNTFTRSRTPEPFGVARSTAER